MDNKKKLYRSRENRMIAGVCGGLGEYFDIDPVLIRIVFLLLTLMSGAGVFFYIFCVIIIPSKGQINNTQNRVREFADELRDRAVSLSERKPLSKKNILGLFVIFFGFILLFDKISPFPFLRWDLFWFLVIIAVGFYIVAKRGK